ncbi:hypothetical protein CUJ88_43085 [Paraburkholderia hospita]|uniref:Uncharacterized protein n=1 Tax=Paraburkholderia hospita TaxID=169430 RepID=A0AAN1MNF9_9BURK|nr:hypothetical protein C2L64_34330 [Paraburkholderia hospita]AXF05104.1 hypothetical protein CUJ88_43085 [Paraburkholderia hospita]OUL75194.1 hypothetical protein CA602_37060 [Paraburkholderia hospita]OUL81952.1 hypothetical protein CA603_29280 [Paraburkholderia hospita]OUL94345.1 hypothetical protein CA601_08440 [Paraburkholderia hospita]
MTAQADNRYTRERNEPVEGSSRTPGIGVVALIFLILGMLCHFKKLRSWMITGVEIFHLK